MCHEESLKNGSQIKQTYFNDFYSFLWTCVCRLRHLEVCIMAEYADYIGLNVLLLCYIDTLYYPSDPLASHHGK